MHPINSYIKEILHQDPQLRPFTAVQLERLPFYIRAGFHLYTARLFDQDFIVAEQMAGEPLTTLQVEKQLQVINDAMDNKVVFAYGALDSLDRQRLIQKGINFISPGKQLFLPDFLIDLRESFSRPLPRQEKLLPSAQVLLLYYILQRSKRKRFGDNNLKEQAALFGYTQTGISKAAENLRQAGLCRVTGTKDKYLQFNDDISTLWKTALPFLVNPVLRVVYIDVLPDGVFLLRSNVSALPEYSDMADSRQEYRAMEKTQFYKLQENKQWVNLNDHEGRYSLEIWKYDPAVLVAEKPHDWSVVDPLSLYLSLKGSQDERIEMALEQIIDHYTTH